MPTKKLYWEDPYQREFDAVVGSIDNDRIILNQSCFYPRGGGQVGDTGELNGVRVADVVKNDAGDAVHILENLGEPSFKPGDVVHGKIDWDRRYKIMKLHSAAHIVYNFMLKVYPGAKVASSGIVDERKDKQDYILPDGWDKEKLAIVEKYANDFIAADKEIKCWTDADGIRHWLVSGMPDMHCSGTHVKLTSEIGRVSVKRGKKPGAGKERIEILLVE